jgi:hypothetical protein
MKRAISTEPAEAPTELLKYVELVRVRGADLVKQLTQVSHTASEVHVGQTTCQVCRDTRQLRYCGSANPADCRTCRCCDEGHSRTVACCGTIAGNGIIAGTTAMKLRRFSAQPRYGAGDVGAGWAVAALIFTALVLV